MKNSKLIAVVVIVIIAILAFVVIQSRQKSEPENEIENVQIPNPASLYCVEQGGTLDIRSDADGNQFGVCVFEDGTEIEEWEYFNSQQMVDVQIPNPASVYCIEQGGTVDIRSDADGNQFGVCVFEDGTEIEEWELFRSQQPDTE